MKDEQANLPQPLLIELKSTAKHLTDAVASIGDNDFNRTPFEGKWSAAQNVEHLRLSISSSTKILTGPTALTKRVPDQHVSDIKKLFLDFNAKYPSAPSLVPATKHYDKSVLTAEVSDAFNQLMEVSAQLDLTDICTGSTFTGVGQLTRLEWVSVALYHTQRHIHQLELIAAKLG